MIFIVFVFPSYSTLELIDKVNGPQIRITCEISAPEPAPKVWKPKSRSKYVNCVICIENKKLFLLGFLVVSEAPELYRKLREACRKNFH